MPKVNKYLYQYVVQSKWGSWEDEYESDTFTIAHEMERLMKNKNPKIKYRVIERRVKNPKYRGN